MSKSHAVIVGGSKGLGRVIAEQMAALGHEVTILSRTPPPTWTDAVPRPRHVCIDLETLDFTTAQRVAAQTSVGGGAVRYVIFAQRYRGSGDAWAGELQVSLTATDVLIRAFTPHLTGEGDRAMAVISSVYAEFVGGSQPASYHVAKAGLNALVRHNAWTLGRQGVRVNAIMPLTYLKPESRQYYLDNEAMMTLYHKFVPLGRLGEATECANVVGFLCSPQASFVTGQCLFVDGGVSTVWPEECAKNISNIK